MLWPEHILCGILASPFLPPSTLVDVAVGSILPDVGMVVPWSCGVSLTAPASACHTVLLLCYFLPHSLLIVPLVPRRWRWFYLLHILCDLPSHTEPWSIRPLYPLSHVAVHGWYDPWKWIVRT